jgi:hypothetical protein
MKIDRFGVDLPVDWMIVLKTVTIKDVSGVSPYSGMNTPKESGISESDPSAIVIDFCCFSSCMRQRLNRGADRNATSVFFLGG